MSSGVFRKLARARKVAHAAGFLLQKLEAQFGHEFGEGMRIQVRQAISECRQQGTAVMHPSTNAKEAERAFDKRAHSLLTKPEKWACPERSRSNAR